MLAKLGINTNEMVGMSYRVESPARWFDVDEFSEHCRSRDVGQLERLLLLSDGSLTRLLKALFLTDITFRVTNQEAVPMEPEMAEYLDIAAGQPSINRDGWLECSGRDKLVLIHTHLGDRREVARRDHEQAAAAWSFDIPIRDS
jgi:hypothetical protein